MDDFYCTKYFFPLSSSDYESESVDYQSWLTPWSKSTFDLPISEKNKQR